jgi:hypothetical protein
LSGVPFDKIHCPTCDEPFPQPLTWNSEHDPDDFDVDVLHTNIKSSPVTWFIRCPNGHKWTGKTFWVYKDETKQPEILLDRFLGQG